MCNAQPACLFMARSSHVWLFAEGTTAMCHRLLKALSERLKKDRAEREAAKEFEITDMGALSSSMRVVEARQQCDAAANGTADGPEH